MIILLGIAFKISARLWVIRSIYKSNSRISTPISNLPHPLPGQKILIFAPHEDDETLGCGGYISKAVDAGAQVKVVLITNGEYPEVDVLLFEETARLNPDAYIRLGYLRQKETITAMKSLGLSRSDVIFLGYPNQYLNQMWLPGHWLSGDPVRSIRTQCTKSPYDNSMTPNAVYCGSSLLHDIKTVLLREKPDIVITLHPNDIHVDHWPTYSFVRLALEELAVDGQSFVKENKVYTYLIHRDLWPSPRGYYPSAELVPPSGLAEIRQTEWMLFPLKKADVIRKRHAIGMYRTQGGLVDPLLLSFDRRNELFGQIPYRSWSVSRDVSPVIVIEDPVGDRISGLSKPDADIHSVALMCNNTRLNVRVSVNANVKNDTGFHMIMHAGDSSSGNSIVQYDWNGSSATGSILRQNSLVDISPDNLQHSIDGNVTILDAPLPFQIKPGGFIMISAWSTNGKHVVDNTATTTFNIIK